jgi:histidine triad (HIT) family protein
MSDCIFCKIAAGEVPATKVYEDKDYLAFKDIEPKAPQHYLVIPKIHSDRLDKLADDESGLGALFAAALRTAKANGLNDYRLAVNVGKGAGQIVFHTHVHLLAGWHNEPGDMV